MALLGGGSWNGNVMSAFSRNRRRILSLWLPRLPIDRIKRQLARKDAEQAEDISRDTGGRLSPPLRARVGEGGTAGSGVCGLPPSLTLPHNGGGHDSVPSIVVAKQNNALRIFALDEAAAR